MTDNFRNCDSIESYTEIFKKYGNPGEDYLRKTFPRFRQTFAYITESWPSDKPKRMLDIGAHWLHQTALFAMNGFSATAAELFTDEKNPVAEGVAKEFKIFMAGYKDLSDPWELSSIPDNSFDLILFSEILEHITFNPVKMWTQFFRLLSEGGRIVVTTPNYFNYGNGSFFKDIRRMLSGRGSGIKISDILEINTFGHHWRIFSAKDIVDYFDLLSPDFSVRRIEYFDYYPPGEGFLRYVKSKLQKAIPSLRDGLYAEIELKRKNVGIVVKPHW